MSGNVVPNAQDVLLSQVSEVIDKLTALMPHSIAIHVIGSAGQKVSSSDVDVLIETSELLKYFSVTTVKQGRILLAKHFSDQGIYATRTGSSVFIGIVIENGTKVVQVDITPVENAVKLVPLHTHDYSNDPTMSGGTLHAIWADLANLSSTEETKLMMSSYKGLMNRTTKQLITLNKGDIAIRIIGPTAKARDLASVHAILAALHPYPDKFKIIKLKYAP